MKRFLTMALSLLIGLFAGNATAKSYNSRTINLGVVAVRTSYDVSDTWFSEMNPAAAQLRVDALRNAWQIAQAPTEENFVTYSDSTMNNLMYGITDDDSMLRPFGSKSCSSSAYDLYDELAADTTITSDFDLRVVNARTVGGIPMEHYVVKMIPLMEDGPSYLVDRYIVPSFSEVEDEWTVKKRHKFLKYFVDWNKHYTIDTYWSPDQVFLELEQSIVPEIEPAICTWNFDYTLLAGPVADVSLAQAALDAAVNTVADGWAGASCAGYTDRSCPASIDQGIGYLSKCVMSDFDPVNGYNLVTTFVIGYNM